MSRLGGWVRWIGCAAVWEAGRAVCGERHLRWTQAYSPTATEDDGVGRGNIHTYAIALECGMSVRLRGSTGIFIPTGLHSTP